MPQKRLSEKLQGLLDTHQEKGIHLQEALSTLGREGFGIALILLSFPSALPVPAPGYSTPFGLLILCLVYQLFRDYERIELPKRFESLKIGPSVTRKGLGFAIAVLRKMEFFLSARLTFLFKKGGRHLLAAAVAIMASLMILPIPLTNTAPAMVIFLMGVSMMEDDGLAALIALALSALGIAIYTGLLYLIITQGPEAVQTLIEEIGAYVKSLFA